MFLDMKFKIASPCRSGDSQALAGVGLHRDQAQVRWSDQEYATAWVSEIIILSTSHPSLIKHNLNVLTLEGMKRCASMATRSRRSGTGFSRSLGWCLSFTASPGPNQYRQYDLGKSPSVRVHCIYFYCLSTPRSGKCQILVATDVAARGLGVYI